MIIVTDWERLLLIHYNHTERQPVYSSANYYISMAIVVLVNYIYFLHSIKL